MIHLEIVSSSPRRCPLEIRQAAWRNCDEAKDCCASQLESTKSRQELDFFTTENLTKKMSSFFSRENPEVF